MTTDLKSYEELLEVIRPVAEGNGLSTYGENAVSSLNVFEKRIRAAISAISSSKWDGKVQTQLKTAVDSISSLAKAEVASAEVISGGKSVVYKLKIAIESYIDAEKAAQGLEYKKNSVNKNEEATEDEKEKASSNASRARKLADQQKSQADACVGNVQAYFDYDFKNHQFSSKYNEKMEIKEIETDEDIKLIGLGLDEYKKMELNVQANNGETVTETTDGEKKDEKNNGEKKDEKNNGENKDKTSTAEETQTVTEDDKDKKVEGQNGDTMFIIENGDVAVYGKTADGKEFNLVFEKCDPTTEEGKKKIAEALKSRGYLSDDQINSLITNMENQAKNKNNTIATPTDTGNAGAAAPSDKAPEAEEKKGEDFSFKLALDGNPGNTATITNNETLTINYNGKKIVIKGCTYENLTDTYKSSNIINKMMENGIPLEDCDEIWRGTKAAYERQEGLTNHPVTHKNYSNVSISGYRKDGTRYNKTFINCDPTDEATQQDIKDYLIKQGYTSEKEIDELMSDINSKILPKSDIPPRTNTEPLPPDEVKYNVIEVDDDANAPSSASDNPTVVVGNDSNNSSSTGDNPKIIVTDDNTGAEIVITDDIGGTSEKSSSNPVKQTTDADAGTTIMNSSNSSVQITGDTPETSETNSGNTTIQITDDTQETPVTSSDNLPTETEDDSNQKTSNLYIYNKNAPQDDLVSGIDFNKMTIPVSDDFSAYINSDNGRDFQVGIFNDDGIGESTNITLTGNYDTDMLTLSRLNNRLHNSSTMSEEEADDFVKLFTERVKEHYNYK